MNATQQDEIARLKAVIYEKDKALEKMIEMLEFALCYGVHARREKEKEKNSILVTRRQLRFKVEDFAE